MTELLVRWIAALLLGATTLAPPAPAQPQGSEQRVFWVQDTHHYRSPWYAGAHRKMIAFGCTPAPFYDPDPRCANDRGYHHGLDVHMACGTALFAGFSGRVVDPASAGALGPAYGSRAFRIRNFRRGVDAVIGHPGRVFVRPGDRVQRGELVARASDDAAPDGCHLHIEMRPAGGSYQDAVRPHPYLHLRRAG